MSYLVLARKWRPKNFSTVVGQQHTLKVLVNSLDNGRLHHALLFTGTRGVGKTTLARIVAKSLNCEQGVSAIPCGDCMTCQEVDAGHFIDLVEVDAASRTKVDDTRELLDNVQYSPNRGRYKVYLIDEVHMLSKHSFNALLKTLEEPPPHVKFLFATTDPQQLPATILSRCLQLNLRRLDTQQIADHLAIVLKKEAIEFEPAALTAIARAADGSMRDALSLLDQAISFSDGHIKDESTRQMLGSISQTQVQSIINALIGDDGDMLLKQVGELTARGCNVEVVLDQILAILQRIASIQLVPQLDNTDETSFEQLQEIAGQVSPESVQLFYQIALHGKRDLPYAADPESGLTMTLLRMLCFQPKDIDKQQKLLATEGRKSQTGGGAGQTEVKQTARAKELQNKALHSTHDKAKNHVTKTVQTVNNSVPNDKATTLNPDNWLTVIADLKLTGLVGELANNSAFVKFAADKITLTIAPELAHLNNEKTQCRLQSALEDYLGLPVILSFVEQLQDKGGATLASEYAQQAEINQERAIESINNDLAISAMEEMLDAKVITGTIKPLN